MDAALADTKAASAAAAAAAAERSLGESADAEAEAEADGGGNAGTWRLVSGDACPEGERNAAPAECLAAVKQAMGATKDPLQRLAASRKLLGLKAVHDGPS